MMTVLITGASSGIGAGLAKSFAADGHLVIACGRDASRLAALQQLSPNISVRLFDMTDRDACRQALTGCFADLIILCAGTCEYLDHGQVDAALVERVMATNFLGPVNCLAALQTQLEAGDRVVLVSSMAHWLPFPRAEAYGASKAALTWFANSLRLDWEPKGVAVTVVSPGFVDTPLTRKNDFAMPGRVSVDRAVAAIRHGHLSLLQVRPFLGEDMFAGYFKFAFVRNPFDRFVSYCAFMLRGGEVFERRPRDVMRHFLFEQPPEQHILFQPQASLLVAEDGATLLTDAIGRVEDMQGSYDAICGRIGIASRPLDRVNSTKRGDYRRYYDPPLIEAVAARYARDLELFGYTFEGAE